MLEREHWVDGPPHELFKRMRGECPVHWTSEGQRIPRRQRLLVGDDRRRRARGEPRLADLLLRTRRRRRDQRGLPDRAGAGDVHRHGPAQARPHQGPLPGRLHAEADRRPRGRDPRDRRQGPRPPRGPRDRRPGHRRRPARRLPGDRQLHGHPRGGRRDLGAADERGARGERPRVHPEPRRNRRLHRDDDRRSLRALQQDDRRAPREPERRPDQRPRPRRGRRAEARGARDRDGLLPARRRRQRQHQGDLHERHAGAARRPASSCRRSSTTPR